MDAVTLEKSFAKYLENFGATSDIESFLLAYIQLLLLFKNRLPPETLAVILERQKQLRGQPFDDHAFENLRALSRNELNRHLRNGDESTVEANLNRLLFATLLDTSESDFFYLTEPIFEFVKAMKVSSFELKRILEMEFEGFKFEV